ncbi:hypothetical protein Palpr_0318 [Paludibacter propionicigenes WB4]|uniref:Lipoprotein n=1 Tax=Paludibacter propionicigenes (strain DSM 17365 / JCM 13257 / WB4) TaxID=694427 RepID=E4T199_PALPW|nr:hypothetical protein [Paludibacter propionicigenes]ADQ78480.1 hypothetical protein Palpr_0318 [Paludibacter propionicigenes WB4]
MKTKGIYLALVLFSVIAWSCTSQDGLNNQSLKTSITANAQELITAVNSITASSGYGILSNSDLATSPSMVKSAEASSVTPITDTISLSQIAGVYDYKAAKYKKWSPMLFNFFAKTGTSSDFIVRLPEAKIKHPRLLLLYTPADTTLVNDYVIDVSKYNYVFGRYLWNYNLASTITVKNVSIGSLTVQSSRNKSEGQNFVSGFTFANGYEAKLKYSTGDTILSVYNISKGGTTLFEEKFTAIKDSASRHREKQYSLTIGNVQVIRTPTHGNNGLDSAKVYLGGVLQTKAVVKIIDSGSKDDATEFSVIGHNRDLQITFDDGTSTTVNQLLGSTITDVRSLFLSLRQVYFATNVVDWVAWSVKLNRLNM